MLKKKDEKGTCIVVITQFNRFSGTIKFHFYDHFGLDNDDNQFAPGFCDWYILQHYDRYDGKYCPFITIIDMSCDFSGTYS